MNDVPGVIIPFKLWLFLISTPDYSKCSIFVFNLFKALYLLSFYVTILAYGATPSKVIINKFYGSIIFTNISIYSHIFILILSKSGLNKSS